MRREIAPERVGTQNSPAPFRCEIAPERVGTQNSPTPFKREIALERVGTHARLAVIEDGRLSEIRTDRGVHREPTGGVYVGRVMNVLKGMNAAFVDIGLNKNAYLAAGDIGVDTRGEAALKESLESARIEKILRAGQTILCQVIKEPGGAKGPRISQHIALPGRLCVLLPTLRYAGVSRKIEDEAERTRLRQIAQSAVKKFGAGMIARTAAAGADAAEIEAEYAEMLADWKRIEAEAAVSAAPRRIETDAGLAEIAVRDYLDGETERMRTDDERTYRELLTAAEKYAPKMKDRIVLETCETPLFDLLRVDHQLDEALRHRIDLKSGGTIVIDEAEALTVIDVNTGKFTGSRDFEETVFRLNCEAADEIARQIRLRDVGGIIIVDFIDMEATENREALLERLRTTCGRDRNRVTVIGMTELGLVQMTRKRTRRPLSRLLERECPLCRGSGRVLTDEAQAYAAAREIERRRRFGDTTRYAILTSEGIAERLREIGITDARIRITRHSGYEIVPEDGKEEKS